MSLVVAIDDVKPDREKRIDGVVIADKPNMTFFRASAETPVAPTAYLVRHDPPGRFSRAHFHVVDQFQVIVDGKGKFGRHDMSPYCVHFSRAHTPYGPLRSDEKVGWAFLTLRARYDPGAQKFPESQSKLKQIPDRRPWQITKKVTFPSQISGVSLQEIAGIKDDQGLFACALTMQPHAQTTAPDPSGGDGQYVVVLKGSLVHGNKEHQALTMVFVKPEEHAFEVHAGAQGLEALVLNFPQVKPRTVDARAPSATAGFRKWQCALCSFAYDEALGMPEDGIPAGTRWEDVPESWNCPDCSASKSDFEMVEVPHIR